MDDLLIFNDNETTGIVEWKKPSGGEDQPHLVQMAALLVDPVSRKTIQSMDVIIKPDGWIIPDEAVAVHGITTEYANDVGISEKLAFEMFLDLWSGRKRIMFSTTYDNRIIRIGTKRYFSEDIQDAWKAGSQGVEWYCTMINSRKVIGGKTPKLEEAHEFFFGKKHENAHNAMADAVANMNIYFAIQDHQASAA